MEKLDNFPVRKGLERNPNHTEKLRGMLGAISKEINEEAKGHGLEDLVDSNCAISMDGFLRSPTGKEGGIYTADQIKRDKEEIKKRELEFSGANEPAVQKHFREQEGLNTPEQIVEHWRKSKENNKNGQTEMAITVLLHKILKGEFLVVRSATSDDHAGVDNLILNKHTGEVICAFDEVHEGGAGERTDKKVEKITRIAQKGGIKIRYSIGLEQGKLKRSKMDGVPVFYLGLKSEELMKLLASLQYGTGAENSETEYEIFQQLVNSLREQKGLLESLPLSSELGTKLKNFEETLQTLERFCQRTQV